MTGNKIIDIKTALNTIQYNTIQRKTLYGATHKSAPNNTHAILERNSTQCSTEARFQHRFVRSNKSISFILEIIKMFRHVTWFVVSSVRWISNLNWSHRTICCQKTAETVGWVAFEVQEHELLRTGYSANRLLVEPADICQQFSRQVATVVDFYQIVFYFRVEVGEVELDNLPMHSTASMSLKHIRRWE